MLENIREGVQKPWVKIVIFAVVISFIFTGGFSATSLFSDPHAVATVDGESISRNEFRNAYEQAKARNPQAYQNTIKSDDGEKRFQENIMQQLITQKIVKLSVADLGLNVSDSSLRDAIQSDPSYQKDGEYSAELARQTIQRAGLDDESFKDFYRNREVQKQLFSGLFSTEFSLDNEVSKDYQLTAQKRSGRALKINFEAFKKDATASDEELQAYYEANQEDYRIQEKIAVEYLELSIDSLKALQKPTDDDVQQYYDENIDRFKLDAERQYSHILINGTDDEALKKANAISERIKQGEDFATIAKTESDDIPTRETGGDLGIMIPGALEPASEEAVKALANVGDVTEPVKLDSGYQLLKLTAINEGKTQPLSEVKAEILTDLSQQQAEETFFAQLDILKDKTFSNQNSLSDAAEALGLKVQTSPLFTKTLGKGLFANQDVRDTAFSSQVIQEQLNSEVVDIADNHAVVVRLKEHQPSEIPSLEQVKDKVKERVISQKSKQAAYDFANSLLDLLEKSEDNLVAEKIKPYEFKWVSLDKVERNNASLSFLENTEFFKMPKPAKNEVSVDLVEDFQNYTLLELASVESGDLESADESRKKQRQLYIGSFYSNAGYTSYVENLRNNSDVKRKPGDLVQ